jgi:hypothetical protein
VVQKAWPWTQENAVKETGQRQNISQRCWLAIAE